jgi:hypothetical protein
VGPKHFQNKARREWWSIHLEAWQRSGSSRKAYCRQHRLDVGTFARWINVLAGEEAARKLANIRRNCVERNAAKRGKKGCGSVAGNALVSARTSNARGGDELERNGRA